MTEITPRGSQLDRIDGKLDQVLDRLTRMEERADSHGGTLHAHAVRIDELSGRMRDVEIAHAVSSATGTQAGKQLQGRWAALGTVAIVILGSIGAFIGNLFVRVFGG